MSLRRAGTLVFALALTACHTVTMEPQPADLVFATFNSTTGVIPIPNDLVIQKAATATPSASLPAAQIEVLKGYAVSGGFPSDVEVKIDIPLSQLRWNASLNGGVGAYETVTPAPSIDLATVTASTVTLLKVDGGAVTPVAYEAVTSTPGKLTLRKPLPAGATSGPRRWAGGRYVVALRGGPSGVKTTDGLVVNADQAIALAIQNLDLSIAENQPPGFPPELAGQVNALAFTLWNKLTWQAGASGAWTPGPAADVTAAFPAVDSVFPYRETAVLATFAIDKSAHVALDSAAGQVPFPSDFLLEQNPANCPTGVAPCVVNNPAFGPAAQGLRTLDGFTTTGLLTATLTGPVTAASVTWGNVHLFELPSGGLPVRVKDLSSTIAGGAPGVGASYVTQPPGTSAGGFTTTLVLAPAVTADLTTAGLGKFYLPPLKEKTRYAVIVTKRVKNADGTDMTRSAAGNILLGTTAPLYGPSPADPDCATDPAGAACTKIPYVSGIDLASAQGLQALRDGLAPLLASLPALTGGASTKDDVAMVYTISTQTVTTPSTSLLAFAEGAHPTAASFLPPAQVAAEYGVPAAAFPAGTVSEFAEVTFDTLNLVVSGRTQGMLDTAQPTPEPLVALVALPDPASPALVVGSCPAAFPATARCAPLVVFRHGIPRSRGDMLPIAARLAAQGFIVAAIDGEKFGDRTYCGGATQAAADQQCFNLPANSPPSTCVDDPKLHTSVDPAIVGRCSAGLLRKRVDCGLPDPECFTTGQLAPKGVPAATGQFLISTNFFRTRDTFRQDIIDEAALVNALAPTAPPTAGADAFYDHLASLGLAVHPDQVHFASISLGSFSAALSVAVNPRFKKGAFSSGPATITDTFFNPDSKYYATAVALLASLDPPVLPGTTDFLQFQQVAKWILDPAEAANYGALIKASGKPVLSQIGLCDGTVPNAQSEYFTAMLGLTVPPPVVGDTTTGFTQWYSSSASTVACTRPPDPPSPATVGHGWLIDPTAGTLMTKAQDAYANFLSAGTAPPTLVTP